MIQFKPTRNIDLIEAVGNHPDIIAGSNNGDGYDYKPECRYFEVNVHGQFGGIVYYQEIQPQTFDCHAMYLPEIRGFSKEIGLAFWRYILTNTTVQCVPESCCCGGDWRTWFDSYKQSTGYDCSDSRSVVVIKPDEQLQQSGKRWAWCAARSGKRRADVRQQHEQHCTAKRSSCRC